MLNYKNERVNQSQACWTLTINSLITHSFIEQRTPLDTYSCLAIRKPFGAGWYPVLPWQFFKLQLLLKVRESRDKFTSRFNFPRVSKSRKRGCNVCWIPTMCTGRCWVGAAIPASGMEQQQSSWSILSKSHQSGHIEFDLSSSLIPKPALLYCISSDMLISILRKDNLSHIHFLTGLTTGPYT